jgi:predicted amidohydrolase YtcJ
MKLKNLDYWQSSADLIATNGKVVTVDNNFSIAQAVAVKDGKFIAVGSDCDIKNLSGSRTQVINLKGKTPLPGINDAYAHIADWSDGVESGRLKKTPKRNAQINCGL